MNSEVLAPGAKKSIMVAAFSEDIKRIELKFHFQLYLGYYLYALQPYMPVLDEVIRIDSVVLTTRGGTKRYLLFQHPLL